MNLKLDTNSIVQNANNFAFFLWRHLFQELGLYDKNAFSLISRMYPDFGLYDPPSSYNEEKEVKSEVPSVCVVISITMEREL